MEVQACVDHNTLFRANSLASKALDYYMKHVGMDYLSSMWRSASRPSPAAFSPVLRRRASLDGALTGVLKLVIETIISGNRSCEIDPTRLEKGEDVDANTAILDAYINYTLDCIFSTTSPLHRRAPALGPSHPTRARSGPVSSETRPLWTRLIRNAPAGNGRT